MNIVAMKLTPDSVDEIASMKIPARNRVVPAAAAPAEPPSDE